MTSDLTSVIDYLIEISIYCFKLNTIEANCGKYIGYFLKITLRKKIIQRTVDRKSFQLMSWWSHPHSTFNKYLKTPHYGGTYWYHGSLIFGSVLEVLKLWLNMQVKKRNTQSPKKTINNFQKTLNFGTILKTIHFFLLLWSLISYDSLRVVTE